MQQQKNKKFQFRAKLPSIVQVNKKLLLAVLAGVVLVVGLVIIKALGPTEQKVKPQAVSYGTTEPSAVSSGIQQLPEGYGDIAALRKYMQHDQKVEEMKQQMAALQEQQEDLQEEISALREKAAQKPEEEEAEDPRAEEAKLSNVFFPGATPVAPKPTPVSPAAAKAAPAAKEEKTLYQGQNMQSQKIKFMEEDEDDQKGDDLASIYNLHSMKETLSPYEVQAGTIIPAALITGIDTSIPGEVVAQVRHDVYDTVSGRYLLIPKGSKIVGKYDSQVSYGQARVLIAFTRIIRPDGSSMLLGKLSSADLGGRAGIAGLVDNHWGSVIAAATLSTLLSVGTGVAGDKLGGGGTRQFPGPVQDAFLGAAGSINQTGQSIVDKATNVQPTITVPAGSMINIIVNKDMIMDPYKGA